MIPAVWLLKMAKFIKASLYLINTLNIILIGMFFIFSINAIVTNYKKTTEINKEVEEAYYNTVNKYRKVLIFLLKNNLPTNIPYINSTAIAAYNNIPSVKSLNVFDSKDKLIDNNKPITNSAIETITECYSGTCLNVTVEKKELFTYLLKGKSLYFFELKLVPTSKLFTLKLSISKFINKYPLFGLMLLYFAMFYFFQSLWLFFNNRQLKTVNYHIRGESEKNKVELANQVMNNDKFYRSITIVHELLNEYFTHYIHEILTGNVFVEEISLMEIFQQIEDYCSSQLVKQGLKFTLELNTKDNIYIKSDRRVLFIVLLNYIYRAVKRAKIASEIRVTIGQDKDIVCVNLEDVGYEYIPRINNTSNKIYLCELPKPILEELCSKLGVKISEERNNDNNKTSINIMKELEDDSSDSKIIHFKPYVLHN